MMRHWTFSRKLAAALALMLAIVVIVGALAIIALRAVVQSKDDVINVNAANVAQAERLFRLTQEQRAALRDYLLTADEQYLTELESAQTRGDDALSILDAHQVAAAPEMRRLTQTYRAALNRIVEVRRRSSDPAEAVAALNGAVSLRQEVERTAQGILDRQRAQLQAGAESATGTARTAMYAVGAAVVIAVIIALVSASTLTRTLTAQIGSAVQHVQSSAAELQTAANQQASGSKEQATAMAEITTTISELLATSRQIAESAQRVARVAEETAASAESGDNTVQRGGDAIGGIKRQVDAIVAQMLDLGRKSQEIGGIVEIITELAEQTNILSINAAIEASGAGDSGRRFGVVAEEIRRLADRVAGSAKEIRGLVQDVRAAVNASVMATETASKTVDAGTGHFSRVAESFREIAVLVRTTNEAAREIELSTKQQSSAVEQVNRGVADVAQAARETEVTSAQMLETVSQLARLSTELSLLTQARTVA
jgi:methyl-accepting chemotaxis protein